MPRAAKGAARTKARKRILRAARGYWGTRSRHKQQAKIHADPCWSVRLA